MNKKYLFAGLLLSIITCSKVFSQSLLDSVNNEIYRINKVFDSTKYMSFDVNILYYTDTVYGRFERQEKKIEYSLNNSNYYYKSDELIFMQNDLYTVSIDNSEKSLIVTRSIQNNLSNQFELKNFIGNNISAFDSLYDITISSVSLSANKISLTAKPGISDSILPGYRYFSVLYDTDSYYPQKMEMELLQKLEISNIVSENLVKQKMEISFSRYRPLASTSIFNNYNYFYYDKNTKQYLPAEKYNYYKFFTAGLDEEENEEKPQNLIDKTNN